MFGFFEERLWVAISPDGRRIFGGKAEVKALANQSGWECRQAFASDIVMARRLQDD
jgi:hypothetical protein